jgi:protein phosphatase
LVATKQAGDAQDWPEIPAGGLVAARFLIKEPLLSIQGHPTRHYLAEDQETGRPILVREALSSSSTADALRREFDILRSLAGPAYPQVVDLVEAGLSTFLVQRHLQGIPLAEAWSRDTVSLAQRLDWLIQLCDALNELHTQEIVYLNVHPHRLLVTDEQRLVLADFSQARRLPIPAEERLVAPDVYSAAEILRSPGEVTYAADIYGFGATWYALLLGKPPGPEQFEGMLLVKPPVESLPDLLPAINRVIVKAMQRLPQRRHKSMHYVRDSLREIQEQLTREPSPAVGVYSDTGIARDANEDSHLVEEFTIGDDRIRVRCGLYLISDGMGGEAGGAVASQMTAERIGGVLLPKVKGLSLREIGQDLSDILKPLFQDAANQACAAVHNRAQEDALLRKMGATTVSAVLLGSHLYVANVGDSRAYLINASDILRLSRDHTVVGQLIERGELTEEKSHDHPAQGQLTRNIGARPTVEVDFQHRELKPGDLVLLCCDGLTDVVHDEEIREEALSGHPYQRICEQLVNLANGRGGPDNVTIILTSFEGGI